MADNDNPTIGQEFAAAFATGEGAKDGTATGVAGNQPAATAEGAQALASREGEGADGTGTGAEGIKPQSVEDLLKDPALAPQLQSWADKAAANQVRSALERERDQARQQGVVEGQAQLREQQEDRYFSSLSQEELGRELAEDPELATRYANYQQRKATASLDADGTARTAQVLGMATVIQSVQRTIAESGLSDADKAALAGEKFTQYGDQALIKWQQAVSAALVKHEVDKTVTGALKEQQEADGEEDKARQDALRPGALAMAGGTAKPMPDLMKNSSRSLFEDAFRK